MEEVDSSTNIFNFIRLTNEIFDKKWLRDLKPLGTKLSELTLAFLIGYFGGGYGWILFFSTLLYIKYLDDHKSFDLTSTATKSDHLTVSASLFPSWANYPDVERAEWMNDIVLQLWTQINNYSTEFVKVFIEPKIKDILQSLALKELSGFEVKNIDCGTIPLRLGGIKVYKNGVSREQILLDVELLYSGNARIQFCLQKVNAEIRQIRCKGTARISLKPLLNTFPLIGGFELTFLEMPSLNYSLGGIGTLGEIPGINKIIKTIVESQITSHFVWPNKLVVNFPMKSVLKVPTPIFKWREPTGLLIVKLLEARNLVAKDKVILGHDNSDPYAVLTLGNQVISFQSSYIEKSLNPVWNYTAEFIVETLNNGSEWLKIEVYDYDHGSQDDFMGKVFLSLKEIAGRDESHVFESWIPLQDVKKGEIHVQTQWFPILESSDATTSDSIVSLFIDSCSGIKSVKERLPSPKAILRMGDVAFTTLPKHKTENPIFEENKLFHSKSPKTDEILIEIYDSKSSEFFGRTSLSIEYLLDFKNNEVLNLELFLLDCSFMSSRSSVIISAKVYFVNKP